MNTSHNVHGIKIGSTLNVYIDGELHKKTFESDAEAVKAYKTFLVTQANPTEANIIALLTLFKGKKFNIAKKHGLEYNLTTGEVYLDGFNTPLPELLIKTFEDYSTNNFPVDAIKNFWSLLMTNPDAEVRERLFEYIQTYNLVITKYGYFLAYKAVTYGEKPMNTDLSKFVVDTVNRVKTQWKTSPKHYTVYKSLDDVFMVTKTEIFQKWNLKEKGVTELGNLADLFEKKTEIAINSDITYTDKYTGTMTIKLGQVCHMLRTECDRNSSKGCSVGLHVGSTKYVNTYASDDDQILMCLINPAHVVAIPNSDTSKIRVSEYFPFALADRMKDGSINAVDSAFFESDYIKYEAGELKKMIDNIKANEAHIKTNGNLETRNSDEILDILVNRVTIINK